MWGRYVGFLVLVAILKEAFAMNIVETIGAAQGECMKKFPASEEDAVNLFQARKMADSYTLKCMAGCICQKIGIMSPTYELQADSMIDILKNIFSDNPDKLKSSMEVTTLCANKVNSADIGDKHCERSAITFKCFEDNRVKYNFDLFTFS